MAYSRRSYKGASVTNALGGGGIAANATTITLANVMSGWTSGSAPFFVVIDPGTSKEEKVCVVYSSTTTLTVVDPVVTSGWVPSVNGRGADDTTDRAHDPGATIYPVFTATEANQANDLVSKYSVNGDIVVHGLSGLKTVPTGGSGNNNKVLVADSTVTDGGVKWSSIGENSIADGAITSAKILNGTIIADDIASNAVTSVKILNDAVTTAKILDANVTNAKLDYATIPRTTVSTTAPSTPKTGDVWIQI